MARKRRKHSDEFKAKVALEAVKGVHTLSELSSMFKVHPTVIAHWKRQLVDGAAEGANLVVVGFSRVDRKGLGLALDMPSSFRKVSGIQSCIPLDSKDRP